MHRLITPIIFLVCLLGGFPSLHAQADQQPDFYFDCQHAYEAAVDELLQEELAIWAAHNAIDREVARIVLLESVKKRPDLRKLARLAGEAIALHQMLDNASVELGKTREYLDYTKQKWVAMVNTANQLDVGHPRMYFAGSDRAGLAALALQVRSGMHHTRVAHADAGWYEQLALDYVPYTLLEGIEDVFVAVLAQHATTSSAISNYFDGCIGHQPSRIIGIVVANLHAFINDGPNGEVTALKAHPSYIGQSDTVDISDAFKFDRDGETKRSIRIGFEIPDDAKFAADVKGAVDEELARKDDPLATIHNLSQQVPNFGMNGNTFENDGNGLTLHYRLLDDNIATAGAGERPHRLVAGESDSFPLTLVTTGTKKEIANGEVVEETYEIFAMGDGVNYLSFRVKLKAALEAPTPPPGGDKPPGNPPG